jgi:hypothetical protein
MVMSNNSMQTNSRCPQRWLHHFWFGWQFALQSFRTAAVADLAVRRLQVRALFKVCHGF